MPNGVAFDDAVEARKWRRGTRFRIWSGEGTFIAGVPGCHANSAMGWSSGYSFHFLGHAFSKTGALYESDPFGQRRPTITEASVTRLVPLAPQVAPSSLDSASEAIIALADTIATTEDDPLADVARPTEGRHAERLRRLYLKGQGVTLTKVGEAFRIVNGSEIIADVPPAGVDHIELGPAAACDTDAIRHALRHGIAIDLIDGRGGLLGRIAAPESGQGARILAQTATRLDPARHLRLVRAFVGGRIGNQRALLHRLNRRRKSAVVAEAANAIGRVLRKLIAADSIERLRGYEGEVARIYWPAFGSMFGAFSFTQRERFGGGGAPNLVLDILAGLLQRDIRVMLTRAGLHSGIGFLHVQGTGDWSLASDMVEEFRAPIVESLTCYLFNNRLLDQSAFVASDVPGEISPRPEAMVLIVR